MINSNIFTLTKGIHPFSIISLIAITGLSACFSERAIISSTPVHKEKTVTQSTEPELKKVGEASWYGPGFENQKTANGETFKAAQMTAASPDLPLGSTAVVTNLDNGKKTEVRINDRGPYAKGRILDLSQAAAKKLGMTKKGASRVKVVVKRKSKITMKKHNSRK